jgi:hypothetical protein
MAPVTRKPIDTTGDTMKPISTTLALTLTAIGAIVPAEKARADGGVVLIGVGAYLAGDYVVGRTCHLRDWPFNIVRKVYYGLHGKRVCRYYRHK